jgi:predicted HD phosphohydrolase
MTEHEAASFEMEPFWEEAVRLRRIDDRAKDPELSTDRLDRFLELIDADLLLTDACAGQ